MNSKTWVRNSWLNKIAIQNDLTQKAIEKKKKQNRKDTLTQETPSIRAVTL
jgi:hypothetical protein